MELDVCPECGLTVIQPGRGRPRRFCSLKCTRGFHARLSRIRRTESLARAMSESAMTCPTCSTSFVLTPRTHMRRYCSNHCLLVAHGQAKSEQYTVRVCALDGCDVAFVPVRKKQRCCCESHGKRLYNRESRADGRQANPVWDESRRARWKARHALSGGARNGYPFDYSLVFDRDGWACGICGEPVDRMLQWPDPRSVSLDHVVPVSLGGSHSLENTQCAHLECNVRKGARLLAPVT